MATAPPAPVPKKSGCGCLGCGCLILAVLALLFLGLVGGIGYLGYREAIAYTSPTPPEIPSFDGGDDAYNRAKQKLTDFDHDLQNHQAATVNFSADEINTLLTRNPEFTQSGIHLFVTLNDDQARVQASIPSGLITAYLIKNRYLAGDASFGLHFQPDDKSLNFDLKDLVLGGQQAPKESLPGIQSQINPAFNQIIRQNAANSEFKLLLDHAKTIEIKDGELVIETQ